MAQSALERKPVLINQIDLIDVDSATSSLRGTTWAHVYSPSAATYVVNSNCGRISNPRRRSKEKFSPGKGCQEQDSER